MSNGFVKIYGSILQSSIWLENAETKVLWITMLAMADQRGMVDASVIGLAHAANISREKCEAALATLSSPDPNSKSKQFGGRRVRATKGVWLILNYTRYREVRTAKQVSEAERKERWRKSKQDKGATTGHVPHVPLGPGVSTPDLEADADAKGERAVPAPHVAAPNRNGNGVDVLAVGELVQRIKALEVKPPVGNSRIPRPEVEKLGPDVLRAYDAIGGMTRFIPATGEGISFLIREFGQALNSARQQTAVAGNGSHAH